VVGCLCKDLAAEKLPVIAGTTLAYARPSRGGSRGIDVRARASLRQLLAGRDLSVRELSPEPR
jgi:hypothetical protein